jgi:catechol 2,3-dioxygenase-like lactoylglutathione lyase family enzyme
MPTDLALSPLPSRDLTETLAFYRSLGFEEVFGQLEPDQYGIVRRGPLELHFFGYRELVPTERYGGCCLRVADVDGLFRELAAKGLPAEGNGNLLRVGRPV